MEKRRDGGDLFKIQKKKKKSIWPEAETGAAEVVSIHFPPKHVFIKIKLQRLRMLE